MKTHKFLRGFVLLGLVLSSFASPCWAQLFSGRSSSAARSLVVEFLDVGQGDSILIRSPEGKMALVDAGPTRDGATQLLKRKGITALDLVVVSHHHSDHYGGMDQVIRTFKPKYFLATGSSHTTRSYLKLLQTVRAHGITAIQPTGKRRRVELGSVVITILPQPPENKEEENDNSIGLRLQYGSFSVLMTGDSEAGERRWWVVHDPELVRDCTILKLAHHGSRNGTDARWLNTVRPELAVASLGKGNEYGHPHSETVSLLRKHEIPLLRTDQRGTITIQSNGREWHLVIPPSARRGGSRDEETMATAPPDDQQTSRPTSRSATRRR